MKSFTVALCLSACFVAANGALSYLSSTGGEIGEPGTSAQTRRRAGVVDGVRPCADNGPGHFVQWRVQGCNKEGTCQFPADGRYKYSEFEFIPARDSDEIGVRLVVIEDGKSYNILEGELEDSSVETGHQYLITTFVGATEEAKGKHVTAQYTVFRTEDNSTEVCAEADFDLV